MSDSSSPPPPSTHVPPSRSPSETAMGTYTQQDYPASLARSNSFFGTIRSLVTNSFAWFAGAEGQFEDTNGKRRRPPVPSEDVYMEDESLPSRPKKIRVSSPVRDTQPYLDPPRSAFTQSRPASDRSMSDVAPDFTRSPRKTLRLPSASSTSNQLPRSRRTLSPLPSSSYLKPQGVTRTMSLDPPSHASLSSRIQPTPTIQDLQPDTRHARNSVVASREVSMSPRRPRVRSSLTPQPSGTGFGPVVPPRRERGPDDPPPLGALMSNPMFVKPPPAIQKQSAVDPPNQLTLGSLVDSQRSGRALARQSSILFGTGSMTDVSACHLWPVNKAEIALHELEVYKSPLLPTRLKGAAAVPDMFLHKERKHITLMTDDRPAKPRLGTKSRGKDKGKKKERGRETTNGTKPYAGEGGMKKWLARRKKEEEEAKERERTEAMADERAEEEEKRVEAEAEKRREEELKNPPPPPPALVFDLKAPREGPPTSSLRVGRMRVGRSHLERPLSRRAKYSAAFEDEDEDMEESRAAEQKTLEEAARKAPVFELPAGFTFAKEATITHDLAHAKEPPITSLPFSLTKPAPASAFAPTPLLAEAAKETPITASSTLAPTLPTISLVPPTPEAVKVSSPVPPLPTTAAPTSSASSSSGIPNFFANSSVLVKQPATGTPPSLPFTAPAVEQTRPPVPSVPKVVDTTPLSFGAEPQSTPAIVAHTSDTPATSSTLGVPALPKEGEKPPTVAPSLALPFTFGTPAKPVESIPASTPSLSSEQPPTAESAKPAASSNATPFAFGVATSAPSPAPTVPAATTEAPKSVFAFGQPAAVASTSASAPGTAPPSSDISKSLFGTPPPATPFSFAERPSTVPAETKPAATPFSFGPPTAEKKPTTSFTFGPSATPAPAPIAQVPFNFGTAPGGTTATDVSTKPFAFGSAAPTRPVTPPKAEQEVTMDESPARDMVLNGSSKAPERPTLNFSFTTPSGSALFAQSPATTTAPFSFGASGATANPFTKEEKKDTKPTVTFGGFGQASSTGFSFGQKPPESPATTTPAPAPFQFGQPSPNIAPASPFSFGAPPTPVGAFGQPSAASAPSSPSTFNRPTSFGFTGPAPTQPAASPFAFGAGSQPASPATNNTTLPSGATGNAPFTFGAGANAAAVSAVSFGAPGPAAAPAGGGSLFTMGSAPAPMEGAGGRRIKSLPRRGGRR